MYADKQVELILRKMKRLETMLHPLMFERIGKVEMSAWTTKETLHRIPDIKNFQPCHRGQRWEEEGLYCWFAGNYTVCEAHAGQALYIFPKIKGYEGFLWVNGRPYGNFTSKIIVDSHGNHYCDLLTKKAQAGENAEGLPLVDEEGAYSFSIFCDDSTSTGEFYMLDEFKKQTNVDVELRYYPYDTATERLNLDLNSGNYADVIGGWTLSDSMILTYGVEQGVFIPLEDIYYPCRTERLYMLALAHSTDSF